jgi:hypothetical protein
VRVGWYDGGLRPPKPEAWPEGKEYPPDGILFYGKKGVLFSKFTGGPMMVARAKNKTFTPPPKTLPRTADHYREFVEAAKGGKPAACNFDFGGLLTELVLLGTIAQRTGKLLEWDSASARFINDDAANELVTPRFRPGWSV